jgi:membrane protein
MAAPPSPWNLGGLSVRELAGRVWEEMSHDEVIDRAAALAYYFLFALFPALLFMTALLGMLPLGGMMERLVAYADQALPPDAASIVRKTLAEIEAGARGGLLSIGALAALWAGSNGMASVMSALNAAYDVDEPRPWWKRRLLAIVLTVGFTLFILAALVLLAFGPRLGGVVAGAMGLGDLFTLAWNLISLPLVVFFVLVGIALVYYLAPASKQHWHWVTPGSAVALVLWLAMSYGLRLYVENFADYGATYGSIGGVILLMLWLYLSGLVLLIGAEINAEIEHAAAARGAVTAKAPGEQAAPVDRVADSQPPVADDVVVAGRVVERWIADALRRGWGPLGLLGGGVIVGWLLRRRQVVEVATTGNRMARVALQVAAAIAALERYRQPRTDAEARQQAIRDRAA